MSRPEFPRCIMPVGAIQRIRQEQAYFDEDPERYEREEQAQQERQREEEATQNLPERIVI